MGTEGESMLQLAAEAFQSKNFDLAAEIYECQLDGIVDPGSRLELMVKRADALVFGGKVTEAFCVYRQASEIHRLTPVHLNNLLECLSDSVKRQDVGDSRKSRDSQRGEDEGTVKAGTVPGSGYDAFSCRICLGFLFEPVTLPCGHSFCKKCLERERRERVTPVRCKECGASESSELTDVRSYRANVVLCNLLAKWFPTQSHAVLLRREGNGMYAEKKTQAALEKYNEALLLSPRDHILFSNRSQIHSSLKLYEEALQDAETACRLVPHWSKGHVHKAQALISLGRCEEALVEYLVGLSIEPECKLARSEALKLLRDLLAPVQDQVQDRVLDYSILLSPRMHIKHSMAQSSTHAMSNSSASPYKASQALGSNPSFSDYPQCPCESAEGSEVKGQGETGGTRPDHRLPLKRKRGITEEEEKEEKREGEGQEGVEKIWKRAKSEPPVVAGSWSSVVRDLIDPTDLECSLCMRLFYEPVTTPCGHTFCLQCLERCLDHNPKCPLCKEELSEHLARRQHCKTVLMENLISKYLPSELMERQKVNQEELAELSNLNKNVPIFVCTMAFPTVPCPLHIFEPCYRLMIRRCMETGTKCFGMCLVDSLRGFADYGCLLEIRNVEFFSDGRSVVDTIGRRRFKVVQHSQRDGYNTADIEYLEDVKVEAAARLELQSLHDAVYDQATVWLNSLKPEQKERIMGHFGPMPDKDSDPQAGPNGPSWCWWLLAVLPLEGRAQLPFLALTSLKERLSGIRRVLLFMTRSRHR